MSTGAPAQASSALQPSPVGYGQCDAAVFPDGSVHAQVAIYDTTCSVATLVVAGSGPAKGAAYHADGYACAVSRETKGSKWSLAWGGAYYAYSCKTASHQVAFNWGTDDTY
jgi:hypothetical protein